MPWSADAAMREMWSELDKNATNGVVQALFRRHLQRAFDAGRDSEMESLRATQEQAIHDRDLAWSRLRDVGVPIT